MKFEMKSAGSVPAGNYTAKFVGIDPYDEHSEYGEGVILRFEIVGGDHDGEVATRICSKKMSSKSNLYQFAKSLAGREIEAGETIDFGDFVGQKGMLIVADRDNGTRVENFLKTEA